MSTMATATTISFADGETPEVSNGFQALRTWAIPGGTVEVRAFRFDGSAFNAAGTTQFGVSNIGLGVCTDTPADACSLVDWQIDNGSDTGSNPGDNDFVLLTFSIPVNIGDVTIRQTSLVFDSDVAYYSQADAAIAPSTSWALTTNDGPFMGPGDFRTINIGASQVTTLLLGTPAGTFDYWTLYSIDVDNSTTNVVPEPGPFVLIGAGLVSIGFLRRRRQRS